MQMTPFAALVSCPPFVFCVANWAARTVSGLDVLAVDPVLSRAANLDLEAAGQMNASVIGLQQLSLPLSLRVFDLQNALIPALANSETAQTTSPVPFCFL